MERTDFCQLAQIQQWKHQNNVQNLFKVREKKLSYRTKLRKRHSRVFIANFVWTDFTYCSEFSIVDFELVNATLKT